MSTVIVFACKSNSCRSQMAEGWAREWAVNERALVEARQAARRHCTTDQSELNCTYDDRLLAFLDGLLVLSVALDESAIVSSHADSNTGASSTKPICVTCDGESCENEPLVRKAVKSKAIKAMAEDGVDISASFPKSINEIAPQILQSLEQRRSGQICQVEHTTARNNSITRRVVDFMQMASREMSMAHAGIRDYVSSSTQQTSGGSSTSTAKEQSEHQIMVDNLIVLCSCSTLKRRLSNMSKQTFDWDIDAPTDAAKAGEGDNAYIRVSREIKSRVDEFMNGLKRDAMAANTIQ